ncbi:hypothetical protein IFT47_17835 [Pseudomonas sp. CFBP 13711]|uniref:hypothetical protein n=1 Tax=unclassified Pseudomonas TaxID=196821 RepID=UPI001782BFB7|nr:MULTISPECIES: hypothetical protein [unclassified Pseudomonas]MBD8708492.1 hypothetical protein [Pseudomonas sp. CFBP 13711]MBD8713934.1 hypothetical protein [Pseudomonas sp. CFBP 13715]
MTDNVKSSGVLACEEALERLITGKPNVAAHVGLDLSKLTAGVVSHEAGFDRGYLKKSRKLHMALIAKISAVRDGVMKGALANTTRNELIRSSKKIDRLEEELLTVCTQRDAVLTQNLQLWERIRQLEGINVNSTLLAFNRRP